MVGKQISKYGQLTKKQIASMRKKLKDSSYLDSAIEKLSSGIAEQLIKSKKGKK